MPDVQPIESGNARYKLELDAASACSVCAASVTRARAFARPAVRAGDDRELVACG
jgi:hypothetical protein